MILLILADSQYEKNINTEYNQDDFLNELIKSEIPGTYVTWNSRNAYSGNSIYKGYILVYVGVK